MEIQALCIIWWAGGQDGDPQEPLLVVLIQFPLGLLKGWGFRRQPVMQEAALAHIHLRTKSQKQNGR